MTLRQLALEEVRGRTSITALDDQRDDQAMAYLYWTPTDRIAASLELIAERYSAKKRDNPPQDVLGSADWTVPLQLIYARPGADGSPRRVPAFVAQDVDEIDLDDDQEKDFDSQGVLVDLAAGYRLPKRPRNHRPGGDQPARSAPPFFRDESFRTSREEVNPRFVPCPQFSRNRDPKLLRLLSPSPLDVLPEAEAMVRSDFAH